MKNPIAERIEAEMHRIGMSSRAELGRRLDIPYHRLNAWWVRPVAKPSASDLLSLAKFFDVSEEYILKGGARQHFSRVDALIDRAKHLDPDLQEELENYLDYLEQKSAHRGNS